MNYKNYIKYLKYKMELKQLKQDIDLKTKDGLGEYFFSDNGLEIRQKYVDIIDAKKVLKCKDKLVKKALIASAVLIGTAGILIGCNSLLNSSTSIMSDSVIEQSDTFTEEELREVNYKLTEAQVLDMAQNALAKIEKDLVSHGAGSMGEQGTPFYPEWFNPKMITAISFMESSYRVRNSDGSPLYGSEIVGKDGKIERARGMCQILPSTLEYINWWLSSVMESDLSYTMEDCDNPEKALEICILINISNCKNFFDRDEQIYSDLNFKDNSNLQGKCVIASYKYGAGNVDSSYRNDTLFDTYLNDYWIDGSGSNYVKRFSEVYSSLDNDFSLE